jgi:hypothetical protein
MRTRRLTRAQRLRCDAARSALRASHADGRMKAPPTGVPKVNPATGKPNSDYGATRKRRGYIVASRIARQR